MLESSSPRLYRQALAGLLVCLGFFYLLHHTLAGGNLLAPNHYDSYALQAQNWLEGRLYIADGEKYAWLELAVLNGKYYQSFPPVPAVLTLPWLLVLGWHPANLTIALYAMAAAAGVFQCLRRAGAPVVGCVFHALLFSLGSNLCWLATSGGVWFQAQVLCAMFCVWAGWAFFARRYTLCAVLLALAVGCRPLTILYLFGLGIWLLLGPCRERRSLRPLLGPVLAAGLIGAVMAGYNFARFGSILEFGHTYLPEFMREENGQFHLEYLLSNLKNLLRLPVLGEGLALEFPLFNGFMPLLANPGLLLWLVCLVRSWRGGRKGERLFDLACVGAAVLMLVLLCLHRTLGGWQFGARYTADLLPLTVVWFAVRRPRWQPGCGAWTLCGMAMLFNLFGAAYMLTA